MTRSKFSEWIESRTGAGSGLADFLNEQIPTSSGWRNTLGSLAGALVLLQIVTGILLALYYVPHPEAAYESLEWLAENITAGAFVRALHYWGASFIIVALFLHATRVFFSGAYKKPREFNWLTGLALFGLMITLAFTGQLLPYNQMGYWAAKVGVEIAASAPIIGDDIRALILGGDTVGALALTRFYALHVVILPLVLGLIIVVHLYLLRRHGPVRPASDASAATEPFFPMQFLRDMVVISIGLVALGVVSILFEEPYSGPIDLTDTEYLPRPEWYLLAHFELLKLTQGEFQKTLVAFVLPNVLLVAIAMLPWLDRNESTAVSRRKPIVAAGTLVIAATVGLTLFGVLTAPDESTAKPAVAESPADDTDPARRLLADGRRVFSQQKCQTCHRVNGRGGITAPDLSATGLRLREDYVRRWLRNPEAFKPDTIMPAVTVPDDQFDKLVLYVMSLDREPQ